MSPLLLLALAPSLALAQDDGAAGLFTDARQLPLVSQSMSVEVGATEALVHLVQVFSNPGEDVGQADYRLWLPEGGAVDGFAFWSGSRRFQATLQVAAEAEANHHAAAAAGRETALMKAEHGLTTFSVYPVPAGGLKQVEVELRLPVVREAGRSHVSLPVDRFLGQPGPATSAVVRVSPGGPLVDWGVHGAEVLPLSAGADGLHLALSGDRPIDLWWAEDGPPLEVRARSVALDDGVALEVQVALNDAGPEARDWDRVEVIVDGSTSMRRRGAALRNLVARMRSASAVPVRFHAAGPGGRQSLPADASVEAVVDMLRSGAVGHRSTQAHLAAALADLACTERVRCVVVTDAQLPGLEGAVQGRNPLLVVADPHEQDHLADRIPASALVWGESDPDARLHALADRLVRPAMRYGLPRVDGRTVEVLDDGERVLAEGGFARHLARVDDAGERLTLEGAVRGAAVSLAVDVERLDPEGGEGRAVRKAYYRARLARMMRTWRDTRDGTLREEITALSLREGIPTAFTSLQVDDPELSLVAIKPGDPVLTVHGEPGLTDVVAWYPFGETRRLVVDPATGAFSDRFLVPRFWAERAYRIELAKRYADGRSEAASVWYLLDEAAPGGTLAVDAGVLRVDTGADTPGVSRVHVEADGRTWLLEAPEGEGTAWSLPTGVLPARFTVVIRDRAGNRAAYPASLLDGSLSVELLPRTGADSPAAPLASDWTISQTVQGPLALLSQAGDQLTVTVGGRTWSGVTRLERLDATAVLVEGDVLWLGTRGGELVRLDELGRVDSWSLDAPEHPVTGLARLESGALLVGVLGEGLREVEGDVIRPSRLDVGSAFITGVQAAPDGDVLVGTAYNGLWRVVGGRALRSRIEGGPVVGLSSDVSGVRVSRTDGAVVRTGRDACRPVDDGNGLRSGSPDLMGGTWHEGELLVAGFDQGVLRMDGAGRLVEVPLSLGGPATRRVNAVESWEGLLWVATEGGLFVIGADGASWTVLPGATHGLAVADDRLGAATSEGVFTVDRTGQVIRQDRGPMQGAWMSVAFHDGEVWGGGMEGVARLGADPRWVTADDGLTAGWATALLADGDRLLVGTYSDGVWSVDDEGAEPVVGLEGQWVPPGALRRIGERVWVGGLGMDPAMLEPGGARRVATPGRDINGFLPAEDGGVWLFTTDGPARAAQAPVASLDR